jgi:hypothetical protein
VVIADASPLTFDSPFVLICAFVVGVLGTTRIVRLIVDDDYPPVQWVTDRYRMRVPEKWGVLVECPWCVAPYVTVVNLAWAWSTDLHWTWWFGNVWAAVSWIAAYLCLRDIPPESRDNG